MTGEAGPPLRRLLAFAIVQLGWSPESFWRATPSELYAAIETLTGEDRHQAFAAFRRQVGPSRDRESKP